MREGSKLVRKQRARQGAAEIAASRIDGFVRLARAFIATHWSADRAENGSIRQPTGSAAGTVPGRVISVRERAWFDALAEQGWSVPGWPVRHGGPDWTELECALWRRECARAGAPLLPAAGVDWAGPAIWQSGNEALQASLLPGIRSGRETWCLGFAARDDAPPPAAPLAAQRTTDGWQIAGRMPLPGAVRARWLLLPVGDVPPEPEPSARVPAEDLLVVDLAAARVRIASRNHGDGLPPGWVEFGGVIVPASQRIGAAGSAAELISALRVRNAQRFASPAALTAIIAALDDIADALPGDVGTLRSEPWFARRLAELRVEAAGLEGLEARWLQAMAMRESTATLQSDPGMAEGEGPLVVLPVLLQLRAERLGVQIGDLFTDAFGYYSLPDPDPLTIDNEGPIGQNGALAAFRQALARWSCPPEGSPSDGSSEIELRDRLVRWWSESNQ